MVRVNVGRFAEKNTKNLYRKNLKKDVKKEPIVGLERIHCLV